MSTSQDQQTANRLFLATLDMREVLRYLDAYADLNQNPDHYHYHCEAILSAAIVAYCRPFKHSRSKGKAAPKVDADELDAVRQQQTLHKLLEAKRDTFIAHADWEARNTELVAIQGNQAMRKIPVPDVRKGLDVEEFRRLAQNVSQECRYKGSELDFAKSTGDAE